MNKQAGEAVAWQGKEKEREHAVIRGRTDLSRWSLQVMDWQGMHTPSHCLKKDKRKCGGEKRGKEGRRVL